MEDFLSWPFLLFSLSFSWRIHFLPLHTSVTPKGYDKIPHRFSFDGRTLSIEMSPGDFQLADQIQIAAENAADDTEAMSIISGFLTGAHSIDLELLRKKTTLDFTHNSIVPVLSNLKVARELRKGTRPMGAPLGSRTIQELPEPIDYKTTNMDVHVLSWTLLYVSPIWTAIPREAGHLFLSRTWLSIFI